MALHFGHDWIACGGCRSNENELDSLRPAFDEAVARAEKAEKQRDEEKAAREKAEGEIGYRIDNERNAEKREQEALAQVAVLVNRHTANPPCSPDCGCCHYYDKAFRNLPATARKWLEERDLAEKVVEAARDYFAVRNPRITIGEFKEGLEKALAALDARKAGE